MDIELVPLCLAFLGILIITLGLQPKTKAIDYWPIVGSLPTLLWNSHRLPEWMTEVFSSLGSGSFFIDGGSVSNLRYLVTCHPQNLEYILRTNFTNFPKGNDFKDIFDILGDGIFSADNESWRSQRKFVHSCFNSAEFRNLISKVSRKVLENQLLPFLSHMSRTNSVVDLQEVCKRFAFDSAMRTILGRDENYLSLDFQENQLADASDDAQEAILYRHAMPMRLWKFLNWLNIGIEKKHADAWKYVDGLLADYISQRRETLHKGLQTSDLLSNVIVKCGGECLKDDKFVRDTILGLFTGGRDTIASGLIWFLWLVAKTPRVEAKLVEELKVLYLKQNGLENEDNPSTPWVFGCDDLKGLVYLHAAMCESLRMYPPLPLNSKGVLKEDVLPDGTVVQPGVQIILAFYSEGKMPWIWGEDCLEFKPERWIDENGRINHEPMSKFFAFNVGPRTCLGKSMSLTQMKATLAAIIFNFHVELVEGHPVGPKPHMTLHMKEGLLVKVQERTNFNMV